MTLVNMKGQIERVCQSCVAYRIAMTAQRWVINGGWNTLHPDKYITKHVREYDNTLVVLITFI